MLSNEHQYTTTKSKIDEFVRAISKLKNSDDSLDGNQNLRKKVHLDALNSQLDELKEEIVAYESIKTV
jgi:hypothetical protein